MRWLSVFLWITSIFGYAQNVSSEESQGFIENEGVQLHYIKREPAKGMDSSKPVLLFIPGLMMPAWIWEKQLSYFSKEYVVIAMDPRSQGDSTQTGEGQYTSSRAKDIKALLDGLDIHSVVLIGWSLAVSEVISYLNQFGFEGVRGVVLVDGFVGFDLGSVVYNTILNYWSEQLQKNRILKTHEFITGMFRQPQGEEYIKKLQASALRMPTSTVMSLLFNYLHTDLRPFLSSWKAPSVKVPFMIVTIAGNAARLESMKEIQRLIPDSSLEIIENAGHSLFVDRPEAFNQILETVLDEEKR
ncbi:MAG: alpha/beta hydrolase [Chlamydiota bacterium]